MIAITVYVNHNDVAYCNAITSKRVFLNYSLFSTLINFFVLNSLIDFNIDCLKAFQLTVIKLYT